MKKALALMMALALVVSALALPVFAESGTEETVPTDQVSSATQNGPDSPAGGQGIPGGRMNRNGQMPGMPGNSRNDGRQQPQTPENGQNGQMPQMPGNSRDAQQARGRGMKDRNGSRGMHISFEQLLTDGVITQDVYDAIMNYIKEHTQIELPNAAQPAESSEPPALPDGAQPSEGSEPPTLPDGTQPAEENEPPALPNESQSLENAGDSVEAQLLKQLLDSGAITREQYDLLITRFSDDAKTPSNG